MESNTSIPENYSIAKIASFYRVEKGEWIFHAGRKFIIKSIYTITAPEEHYQIEEEWNNNDVGKFKLQELLPFIEHKKCWIEDLERPPPKAKKTKQTNIFEIDNTLLEI